MLFLLILFHQILHGVATLSIMAYFCEYGVPEIIVPMLLMEVSQSVVLFNFWVQEEEEQVLLCGLLVL